MQMDKIALGNGRAWWGAIMGDGGDRCVLKHEYHYHCHSGLI